MNPKVRTPAPDHPWKTAGDAKAEKLKNRKTVRKLKLSPAQQRNYVDRTLMHVEYILKKQGQAHDDLY